VALAIVARLMFRSGNKEYKHNPDN
jgi:hypothetical protein